MAQFPPFMKDKPVFLHGGDYNPDQWINEKDVIWPMDMKMAKKAGINTLSVGIFSWAMLEPEEGKYNFAWLDEVMDMLAENGIKAILATPSGARPAWMAEKYPEVLRVTEDRRRRLFGFRHNHCLTSPVYRDKVRQINTALAERYKDHPALGGWHISNEYGGECHCPLCQAQFRKWLKARYGTIDKLNDDWWNSFWAHRYSSFDQVESPSLIGEFTSHALSLAWKRFTTQQFCDFYDWEVEPLKRITPDIPCTTNMMGTYKGINYFELGRHLDRASWDNYPGWTNDMRDAGVAAHASFCHELMRGTGGGKPFLMMECSPSAVNWQQCNRLRQPGILMLQSMQALAHGSDSVQYFQFRKSRGSFEKFHGAVISHDNSEDNRIYREVCEVGKALAELSPAVGSGAENKIAVIFDWENMWALEDARFGLNSGFGVPNNAKNYDVTVEAHHTAFMRAGHAADVIDETCDLTPYRIVCGPMTYMLRPGFAERVRDFVANGGTYISTYCSGWVNEEDLCFMGGFPGPLREVFGIWDEETDTMDATQHGHFTWKGETITTNDFSAVVHPETAEVLATYDDHFYKGAPAVTRNSFGKGRCYYIAARTGEEFLKTLYAEIAVEAGLKPLLEETPDGVICTDRIGDNGRFLFVMNTVPEARTVVLPACTDVRTGETRTGETVLPPYGVAVVRCE